LVWGQSLPDPAERRIVLVDAPRALFRLPKVTT
jgi:hypothetical protein